jgi:hypothetical protein
MDLAVGGQSLGRAAGVHSRALGTGVADAGGTAFDVERSPVGVNVGRLTAGAATKPGEPVALTSGGYRGFVAVHGQKVADIPASWPVNYSVRIPEDPRQPVIAIVVTNEQVTTDDSGRPTLDGDGRYRFDAKARSGYANAIRITLFGAGDPEEITVGHAAVLRTKPPAASDAFVGFSRTRPGDKRGAARPLDGAHDRGRGDGAAGPRAGAAASWSTSTGAPVSPVTSRRGGLA